MIQLTHNDIIFINCRLTAYADEWAALSKRAENDGEKRLCMMAVERAEGLKDKLYNALCHGDKRISIKA